MNALWVPQSPLWHFPLRALVVYLSVLGLLRLGGKRQVGQMGAADFVVLLLISNAVQNAMNGGDNSITAGIALAATLIALGLLLSFLTLRSKKLEALIEGRPRVLINHGKLVEKNLARELMSPEELRAKLRHQDVHSFEELEHAILENDGSLSLTRKGGAKR